MIKNLLKILISILLLFIIFIAYLSYFGVTTSKFNTIIKEQVKKQEMNLFRTLKKEVEIGATGTQKYRIKNGPNKGKVL